MAGTRWAVIQRFLYLEHRLFWDGRLHKQDLHERFGVSIPQSSVDIAAYQRAAPDNMVYDVRAKAYVPTATFVPKYYQPDARGYLSELLLLADDAVVASDTWLGIVPPHAAIPKVRRRLDAHTLQKVVWSIREKQALEVCYQSMSSPQPTERWIAPHALAFDGARWHARAWCYKKSSFIDLVLARFISINGSRDAEIDGRLDREWNTEIKVILAPHPDLDLAHRRAIELDYGMTSGTIDVPMRLALYYYFERHMGLDLATSDAKRRQVIVLNKAEIDVQRSGETG